MLPALQERDCQGFGEALYEFNAAVGEMFAPVQGGVYCDAGVASLVSFSRPGRCGCRPEFVGAGGVRGCSRCGHGRIIWRWSRQRFSHLLDTSVFVARGMNRGAILFSE